MILLMGVSGAGKTTVGKLLGEELGWKFVDGDDYHSAANVKKMQAGIPLTDFDRAAWLMALQGVIRGWIVAEENAILACSALKQKYREVLLVGPEVRIIYLKGTPELLQQRLHMRAGHFMSETMLASQMDTLEEPEDADVIDVDRSPEEITAEIRAKLGLPL